MDTPPSPLEYDTPPSPQFTPLKPLPRNYIQHDLFSHAPHILVKGTFDIGTTYCKAAYQICPSGEAPRTPVGLQFDSSSGTKRSSEFETVAVLSGAGDRPKYAWGSNTTSASGVFLPGLKRAFAACEGTGRSPIEDDLQKARARWPGIPITIDTVLTALLAHLYKELKEQSMDDPFFKERTLERKKVTYQVILTHPADWRRSLVSHLGQLAVDAQILPPTVMNEALAAALGMNDLEREQRLDIFVNGGGGTCDSISLDYELNGEVKLKGWATGANIAGEDFAKRACEALSADPTLTEDERTAIRNPTRQLKAAIEGAKRGDEEDDHTIEFSLSKNLTLTSTQIKDSWGGFLGTVMDLVQQQAVFWEDRPPRRFGFSGGPFRNGWVCSQIRSKIQTKYPGSSCSFVSSRDVVALGACLPAPTGTLSSFLGIQFWSDLDRVGHLLPDDLVQEGIAWIHQPGDPVSAKKEFILSKTLNASMWSPEGLHVLTINCWETREAVPDELVEDDPLFFANNEKYKHSRFTYPFLSKHERSMVKLGRIRIEIPFEELKWTRKGSHEAQFRVELDLEGMTVKLRVWIQLPGQVEWSNIDESCFVFSGPVYNASEIAHRTKSVLKRGAPEPEERPDLSKETDKRSRKRRRKGDEDMYDVPISEPGRQPRKAPRLGSIPTGLELKAIVDGHLKHPVPVEEVKKIVGDHEWIYRLADCWDRVIPSFRRKSPDLVDRGYLALQALGPNEDRRYGLTPPSLPRRLLNQLQTPSRSRGSRWRTIFTEKNKYLPPSSFTSPPPDEEVNYAQAVEGYYGWLDRGQAVVYANDLPMSANEDRAKNLLCSLKGDRLQSLPASDREQLGGVASPYMYVGQRYSTFPCHQEDFGLGSVSFNWGPAAKVWFMIAPKDVPKVKALLEEDRTRSRKAMPKCSQFFRHCAVVPELTLLEEKGIPFDIVVQPAGCLVATLPGTLHFGMNLDYNLAVAINYADKDWQCPSDYQNCDDDCRKLMRLGKGHVFMHTRNLAPLHGRTVGSQEGGHQSGQGLRQEASKLQSKDLMPDRGHDGGHDGGQDGHGLVRGDGDEYGEGRMVLRNQPTRNRFTI